MPCPKCGSETPEMARFCPRCGTTLAGPAPGPPPTAQNQQVRCQACGASSPYGANTCPQCGADLAQPKREPKEVSKKPTGPMLRGCLGAFGFVLDGVRHVDRHEERCADRHFREGVVHAVTTAAERGAGRNVEAGFDLEARRRSRCGSGGRGGGFGLGLGCRCVCHGLHFLLGCGLCNKLVMHGP